MARRVHVDRVTAGRVELPREQGHHLRNVLRLESGAAVELFDDDGRVGAGTIVSVDEPLVVEVSHVAERPEAKLTLTIAAAVPKGPRADWMIEKLSELGVDRFIPLSAARSVVVPEGKNKLDRWRRIATEAAKQSRRRGVMEVGDVMGIDEALAGGARGWVCATELPAMPVMQAADALAKAGGDGPLDLVILIGPEGGWAPAEIERFAAGGLTAITLGTTILRVETAAVAAAAIVAGVVTPLLSHKSPDSRDS